MSVGQESSGRSFREQEGGEAPGFASLFLLAPKFRVPGLFWEQGYLKRTGGWGAGVSKQHLLPVTPRTGILSQIYLFRLGGRAPCHSQRPERSCWLVSANCERGLFGQAVNL